ncbi:putative dehydrogenase [Pullulanibacillus pueri]|uniref:Deoxyfructose oxidoreductase n=1 Tax=Pullulanibacillus pueri TaxID=1437324 RepID=A0A8J3EN29_9BACL|nr:Gfo/Idh/MocA family oxidoreductase [Pullulanibacillus pueri]MBM7683102.1 putative dehydrogenase [Pullulanibacillus pueri]GGH85289.1 deoxyfructose oxidoreductase [Pullulanibacillus pueri]
MKKIRWGVIGSAGIAKRSVIPGIQQSETGEVTAIASRTLEKAQQTAKELNIPTAYGSYEELLEDPNIDSVYIPLPNHLHKEWTIRAAQAGKHVLCEKPLAINAEEAREMAEACDVAGVVFAEAFMYRYHPRYKMIREVIQSGEIGELRGLYANFTFNNAGDMGNVRYKKEWGGGSLYDVGVYPISAARMLLEQEPQAATVHALFSEAHGDVDMMAAGILEFNHGVALTFDCGMWAAGRNVLEVIGTEGRIEVPSAFVVHQDQQDNFIVTTKEGSREVEVPKLNQYSLQADALGRSILYGEALPYPASDAILNMKVLDACLTSARERRRVELTMEGIRK